MNLERKNLRRDTHQAFSHKNLSEVITPRDPCTGQGHTGVVPATLWAGKKELLSGPGRGNTLWPRDTQRTFMSAMIVGANTIGKSVKLRRQTMPNMVGNQWAYYAELLCIQPLALVLRGERP
jgi:hypothetical protein